MRPKARAVRGLRDRTAGEIAAERAMLDAIRGVYERYGFDPLETPFLEYTDALGKFLPDVDRPNAGVFSFRDDDEQWVSLRYDLTAPLARYVAENQQFLPRPFRRYQIGTVFRNDKPGPGRYREFIQCDADTVGSASPAADAEMVMMFADTLEALGLKRGEYVIKLNNRKLLDGILETAGISSSNKELRGAVMRTLDKLDRLSLDGVIALLGPGRKDESGDFTKGVGLSNVAIDRLLNFTGWNEPDTGAISGVNRNAVTLANFATTVEGNAIGEAGVSELTTINNLISSVGYAEDRILIDPGIIRGLDYYTGTVFEAQLKFDVKNAKGQVVEFGSVGGGGRYDDLVARFTGQQTPAVGMSIGVSRLLAALRSRGAVTGETAPLIVVTVFDKNDPAPAFAMVRELRGAGLRAEAYVGTGKMGDQFKYADKRGAALAIIEGPDERARGEVTIKDLALGAELAKAVESRAEWTAERQAQTAVKRADLIAEIRKRLAEVR
jgi:histidyl-tRNA synthetase